MAEYIDNSQYEKYQKISVFIHPNIPPNIIKTYDKYIKGHQAERSIYETHIRPFKFSPEDTNTGFSKNPVTIQDIIASCIYIALSKENIDQAIRTYKENRRVYKRNWFNSIKEEVLTPDKMKPKNPQSLRKYAETICQLQKMDRTLTETKTIEDIMQEKFAEIDNWRSDTSAPITDFIFVSEKTMKSLVNGFLNDITFEALNIIKNDFGGSIEGFNVRFPTALTERPIFSYRSTMMEFEAELLQSELTFFSTYHSEDDEKGTVSDIQVNYTPDVELPATVSQKNITQLLSKYNIDLKQRDLDMKDREIMTQLFNMISAETTVNPTIKVEMREFTRKVFNVKVPKNKHYKELGYRLEKLRNYDYKISVRSKESDELIQTSSISLLNYLHINYEELFFLFTPSEQWIRSYVEKKYINLLTDSYHSIDSPQTKAFMMLLQQERLAEYITGSFTKVLTLKFFRSHMKLIKMGNAALIKELTTHLNILKESKIVVEDFEFINKNSSVKIQFLPLDSREIIAYDFNTKLIGSASDNTDNIIDVEGIIKEEHTS